MPERLKRFSPLTRFVNLVAPDGTRYATRGARKEFRGREILEGGLLDYRNLTMWTVPWRRVPKGERWFVEFGGRTFAVVGQAELGIRQRLQLIVGNSPVAAPQPPALETGNLQWPTGIFIGWPSNTLIEWPD